MVTREVGWAVEKGRLVKRGEWEEGGEVRWDEA